MRSLYSVFLFVACVAAAPAFAAPKAPYPVRDAYLRETPMKMSAGYVTISNPTLKKDALTSASAEWAQKIELHAIEKDKNGVLKMKRVPSLTMKPGEELVLAPSGYHLMIFGLKKPLKAGEKKILTLHFDKNKAQDVSFDVKPITYQPQAAKESKESVDTHAHH